jgi:glycolate oxidase iron-sulfur subunit
MGGVSPGGPGAARSGIARINRPQLKKPRLRVGYFLGCATNHLLPEVAFSLVKVLTHLGCEVIVPPAGCCGLPLAAEGEKTAVQKTMEINRRLFREHRLDAVVTDCSSCSHHLTELGLTGDAQPVYEFCEFLVKVINPEKPSLAFNEAMACHYPCHLKHGRKLAGHLHQIISSIPGVNVVEIPGETSCCGGGGAFYKKENALSAQILQKYTGRLLSSGARSVATLCPSCILQLNRGLAVHKVPVRHAAQLLHASYGLPGSQN